MLNVIKYKSCFRLVWHGFVKMGILIMKDGPFEHVKWPILSDAFTHLNQAEDHFSLPSHQACKETFTIFWL